MRVFIAGMLAVLLPAASPAGQPAPADAYRALVKEYETALQQYQTLARAAKSDAERQKLFVEKYPSEQRFAPRFLDLAQKHPNDPAAIDALTWVLANVYGSAESLKLRNEALALLHKDHLQNPSLEKVFASLTDVPSLPAEKLLRAALDQSPHRIVQARACLSLGQYCKYQAEVVRQIKQKPDLAKAVEPYSGPEMVKLLQSADAEKIAQEAEKLFDRVAEQYSLVKQGNTTLGAIAKGELFELRHLAYGKVAPEIEGQDTDGKKFKLSDYRGKVVVLAFWGNW